MWWCDCQTEKIRGTRAPDLFPDLLCLQYQLSNRGCQDFWWVVGRKHKSVEPAGEEVDNCSHENSAGTACPLLTRGSRTPALDEAGDVSLAVVLKATIDPEIDDHAEFGEGD